MQKVELFKPIKPWVTNQTWGTFDPKNYSQFGFNRHNGVDIALGYGAEVRAPFNGKVIKVDNQPNGGGNFVGFLSDNIYDFPAFTCITPEGTQVFFPPRQSKILIDFLHLDHAILKEGDSARCGELLAIADNTGFSTGPHTHIQPRRVTGTSKSDIQFLDQNDANGSFDPTRFWSTIYAVDYKDIQEKISWIRTLIEKVAKLLQKK
jgi:murein DD-endopeptidase MepM/ murein hydrolase activator NlpD